MRTEPLLYIVDDDPEECYLMHLAITDTGWAHAVQFFSSAGEVLQHLSHLSDEDLPSMLLLDYHMPRINGGELLRMLKASQSFRHLPVVFYSTLLTPNLEQNLLADGALKCFIKVQHYQAAMNFAQTLKALLYDCAPPLPAGSV